MMKDKAPTTEKKELTGRVFLRRMQLAAFTVLFVLGVLVFLLDPFYHFHKPWFGLKAVLNEKEYQVIGTIRNFDYDAVLVGSSVVENVNNREVDNLFGCTSVKIVRSYGGTADLCWFLGEAHQAQEITTVLYNLDPSSFTTMPSVTFASTGCPMYLYDRNPFNDVNYLFNRDVLFKRIPYEIAQSVSSYYDEGKSYNWSADKNFSEEGALSQYLRTPSVADMQPDTLWEDVCTANIDILTAEIEAHPETYYRFFFPPYSMLWWDQSIRLGERDAVLRNEKRVMETLLKYKNVEVYNYQGEEEILSDLNNYMDTLHFTPQINTWILEEMAAGRGRVTEENLTDTIEHIRQVSDSLQDKYLHAIGEAGKFKYGLPEG